MPSFDVVSEVDTQEVDNAVNQAQKEMATRYDFKGSKSELKLDDNVISIIADDSMKLKAITEIISQKMTKRGISTRSLDFGPKDEATGGMIRQKLTIKQGISSEEAKKIVKQIKEQKFKKVQAQIQGEQLRVTGPKRDDLQAVMSFLKENVSEVDLQFNNFRD
ncbi:UNVERIFIED_CONTAM: hypothetical protein GTU68_001090 [Idotea baltica]|nr:hypothetical protein [Idotea baltica]